MSLCRKVVSLGSLLIATFGEVIAQATTDADSVPIITEICVANIDQTIDYANHYGAWVELYNPTPDSISLDGWYVSDDEARIDKHRLEGYGKLGPHDYTCLFFDHHAADGQYGTEAGKQVRFELDRNGGWLYLSRDGSEATVSIAYPASMPRCSYAMTNMEGGDWSYCGMPTPGCANKGHYAAKMLNLPEVDTESQLFTAAFTVKVDIPEGTTLRYTLDGSTPTVANGQVSEDGCFDISQTTVLRLRLFADDHLPSGVITRTYIYKDRDYYLPIVAIPTAPCNLYDDMIGCYVDGKNGVPGRGSLVPSNLNMDWLRPVNFEYLTADGRMIINQETSFEVVGGYSRHFEPASFKLQARKLYDGKGSFGVPVFPHKPYCKYKQILIRNGGNNNRMNGGPRIVDAITQQVLTSSEYYVDAQDYQPAHVFINGKYLATMNVREPNNFFHGKANYGYDEDETDGFEYSGGCYHQKRGTRDAFDKLIELSEGAESDEGYASVCQLLDMEEFVRYMAASCYANSRDWLTNSNNVKGYRSQHDGKFHFVFFDQDLTWENTNTVEAIDSLTHNEVLALYNNLKRNATFRQQFVTSYCILHGSIYTTSRCIHIADSICNLVTEALAFDKRKTLITYNLLKKQMWSDSCRDSRIQSLVSAYQLTDAMNATILTNNPQSRIHLNRQALPFNTFSGSLFGQAELMAEASEGYKFLGWQNEYGEWVSRNKTCFVATSGTYKATYDTNLQEGVSPVCINEVSAANDIFINDYGKSADWIELYNRSQEPVVISSWYFSDERSIPMKYQIDASEEANIVIMPNSRLVVWCDGKPSISQPHLPFKLKNADNSFLSIYNPDTTCGDSVSYIAHSAKESFGRYPDGGAQLCTFYHPTIASSNMQTMYDVVRTSISNTINHEPHGGEIIDVAYYSIDGRKTSPERGIYIRVITYRDGHSAKTKVFLTGHQQ